MERASAAAGAWRQRRRPDAGTRRRTQRRRGPPRHRVQLRPCRPRHRWAHIQRRGRAIQGQRLVSACSWQRQNLAQGRFQQVRKGSIARRPDHDQLSEQHHRHRLDERSARLPAVSGRGRARATHVVRAGVHHGAWAVSIDTISACIQSRRTSTRTSSQIVSRRARARSSSRRRRGRLPAWATTGPGTTRPTIPRRP